MPLSSINVFTCGMQHWQDTVQQLQLAGRSDQLFRVTGLVARVQEKIGMVAGLAQMHRCILQAARGLVVVMYATLQLTEATLHVVLYPTKEKEKTTR